jgi:membrane protease YdiL (CAAX protease family)
LAWLLPAVLTFIGGALFFLVFPQLFDRDATQLRSALEASGVPADQLGLIVMGQLLAAITVGQLINTFPSLGEEVGWRGMLLPLLCERMSERRAAIVSGIIWGLWHAPIIAMGHNYGMGYPGFPVTGILTMVVACTSIGCPLSWLRLRSGSVWPCAVAHGAINAISNAAVPFCTIGATLAGPSPLGLVAGLPCLLLAALCWSSFRRSN